MRNLKVQDDQGVYIKLEPVEEGSSSKVPVVVTPLSRSFKPKVKPAGKIEQETSPSSLSTSAFIKEEPVNDQTAFPESGIKGVCIDLTAEDCEMVLECLEAMDVNRQEPETPSTESVETASDFIAACLGAAIRAIAAAGPANPDFNEEIVKRIVAHPLRCIFSDADKHRISNAFRTFPVLTNNKTHFLINKYYDLMFTELIMKPIYGPLIQMCRIEYDWNAILLSTPDAHFVKTVGFMMLLK